MSGAFRNRKYLQFTENFILESAVTLLKIYFSFLEENDNNHKPAGHICPYGISRSIYLVKLMQTHLILYKKLSIKALCINTENTFIKEIWFRFSVYSEVANDETTK